MVNLPRASGACRTIDTNMDIGMIVLYCVPSTIILVEVIRLCNGKPPKSLWGNVGLWTLIWTLPKLLIVYLDLIIRNGRKS